jgi:hypothetical protein
MAKETVTWVLLNRMKMQIQGKTNFLLVSLLIILQASGDGVDYTPQRLVGGKKLSLRTGDWGVPDLGLDLGLERERDITSIQPLEADEMT